jgi:hypothetical protein
MNAPATPANEASTTRLPRFRFTLRLMLLMILLAGVIFGLIARRIRFLKIAAFHDGQAAAESVWFLPLGSKTRQLLYKLDQAVWHEQMASKYRLAARSPWLPVAADPPAPMPGRIVPPFDPSMPPTPPDELGPGLGPVPKSRKPRTTADALDGDAASSF